MSSGGMLPSPMGNNQDLQVKQDIVQAINNLSETGRSGIWITYSVGHNASGATGTAFTATGHQVIQQIAVSSTAGADAVTINWVDDSASTTHNIITDGVIGAAYPLYALGMEIALQSGDTITYSGADSDLDFIITWKEMVT